MLGDIAEATDLVLGIETQIHVLVIVEVLAGGKVEGWFEETS